MGVGSEEMAGWKDCDVASEIGAAWDFPVYVCNDASTACGAELVFGTQVKPRDFLYVFVGYFVGGGVVLDNSLYTGRSGNAAAFGSIMVMTANGTLRQLVDVASLASLEQTLASSGDQSSMIWDKPESWDIPQGPLDLWLNRAAEGIAQAIISSVCVIDVGHVLIDGWMPEHMRAEIVRRVQDHLGQASIAGVEKPVVTEGSIGADARALGAASLPLSKRFLVDSNSFQMGSVK